jgi:hypothetical protein
MQQNLSEAYTDMEAALAILETWRGRLVTVSSHPRNFDSTSDRFGALDAPVVWLRGIFFPRIAPEDESGLGRRLELYVNIDAGGAPAVLGPYESAFDGLDVFAQTMTVSCGDAGGYVIRPLQGG